MRVTTHLSRMALFGLALGLAGCADIMQQADQNATARSLRGFDREDHLDKSALLFNGVDANTSTPAGTIVTTQIDNISYDAMVRYDGPNAVKRHLDLTPLRHEN